MYKCHACDTIFENTTEDISLKHIEKYTISNLDIDSNIALALHEAKIKPAALYHMVSNFVKDYLDDIDVKEYPDKRCPNCGSDDFSNYDEDWERCKSFDREREDQPGCER